MVQLQIDVYTTWFPEFRSPAPLWKRHGERQGDVNSWAFLSSQRSILGESHAKGRLDWKKPRWTLKRCLSS